MISLAITNKFFLSCLFVSTYQREMQVYTFKFGKNRLERPLEKNYSNLLYFDHPVYRNFHKIFQQLLFAQTALILVNYLAVFSWFLLLLLLLLLLLFSTLYYFLINFWQMSCLKCPNANLLPVWECTIIFEHFKLPYLHLIRFGSVFIYCLSSNKNRGSLFVL